MQNIIIKEKIEQLDRFNNLIKVMNKMTDNMQSMANRIVKLEAEVKRLNEKK
jgi:cell division protein FtsB